jgi:D-threonate/D-erythronate kinase
MIAVMADDLTGAAELAGISLRYGLKVEVCLGDVTDTDADILIVCTDSRSLNIEKAKEVTTKAVAAVLESKPEFIFKKIDSVLRGHVIEEVKIQMALSGKSKAIILPANPSLGRIISEGKYFIDGKEITETDFVNDPEFPVRSCFVKDMVKDDAVKVLKATDPLPQAGIVIGETDSADEIKEWLSAVDGTWMLVGAGDLYMAILGKRYDIRSQGSFTFQSPHLYVSGTAFGERKTFIKKLHTQKSTVAYLPSVIDDEWLQQTGRILKEQGKVVVAIDDPPGHPESTRKAMAKAVKDLVSRENVREIFIEGGSTSAAVLEELGIRRLKPLNELNRGVVRMKAVDLFVTLKPGSYQLPEEIVQLYS